MLNTLSVSTTGQQRYDPFGMLLVGRNWVSGSENYEFGFNGQMQDDEVYGNGNLNTAEFWEYDTRLGRRWNMDPFTFVDLSSYAVLNNNPILFIDPLGNVFWDSKAKRQAKQAAEATGGRAYKAKSDRKDNKGVWLVDVEGTSYGDQLEKQAEEGGYITGQTLVFKPGEDRSNFLREELGVEFWDAELSAESGWGWVQTKLSAGDSWAKNGGGREVAQNVANMNPLVAASNIVSGIEGGTDIYGTEMGGWDYFSNGLSVIPGAGSVEGKVSATLFAKYTGKILTAAQIAKRLKVTVEYYHRNIKPVMKTQFGKEAKELKTTNPDFTPDEFGNVVVINPTTKESITTNVPFDSFK